MFNEMEGKGEKLIS